jgi:ABC-type phosphate transport system substrate-binding protein
MGRFLRLAFLTAPLVALLALPLAAVAGVVVVVNPKSGVERLSRDDVINIFMGRYRKLPSGQAAIPVDLPAAESVKAEFYHLLVGKDMDQIAAYWSRLVFTGRTAPPRQAESVENLIAYIAANPGAVGYLDSSDVDRRMKVVLELK